MKETGKRGGKEERERENVREIERLSKCSLNFSRPIRGYL